MTYASPIREYIWLAIYACVQVISSLWLAGVLAAIQPSFEVPEATWLATLRVGPSIFFVLMLGLTVRDALLNMSLAGSMAAARLRKFFRTKE
jgi:hypothetical protein